MRAASLFGVVVFLCAVLVFTPSTPGQQGKKGKGGGGGGFDPGTLFDTRAAGRTSIPIAEAPTFQKEQLAQFLKDQGITNGQVTKAQYLQFTEQARSKMFAPQAGSGAPTPAAPGGGREPKTQFPTAPGGQPDFGGGPFSFKKKGGGGEFMMPIPGINPGQALNPDAVNAAADIEFRRRDQNGDGKLNFEEMPQDLRRSLAKWDKNNDTFIDRDEFREFFMARILGSVDELSGAKGVASIFVDEEELDRKVVVYRAGGKMPPGMPPWFSELDIDKDGQIALWEWRKAGKSPEDFPLWDVDDNGFITPEEALRQQTVLNRNGGGGSMGNGEENQFFGGKGNKKKGGPFGGGPPGDGTDRPAWGGGGNPFGGGNDKGGGKKGKKGGGGGNN